jgi:hypothetical protein
VPIGQSASVGGDWTAVVNSVNLNANDVAAGGSQFNQPPTDGTVFVLANVTTTYNGDDPSDKTGVRFQGRGHLVEQGDRSGRQHLPDATRAAPAVDRGVQGPIVTGNIVFEVPTADVNSLVLIGHALLSQNVSSFGVTDIGTRPPWPWRRGPTSTTTNDACSALENLCAR